MDLNFGILEQPQSVRLSVCKPPCNLCICASVRLSVCKPPCNLCSCASVHLSVLKPPWNISSSPQPEILKKENANSQMGKCTELVKSCDQQTLVMSTEIICEHPYKDENNFMVKCGYCLMIYHLGMIYTTLGLTQSGLEPKSLAWQTYSFIYESKYHWN